MRKLLVVALCASLAACSTAEEQAQISVRNCGQEVTLKKSPERVVVLKNAAVETLYQLGVMDKVVARAGQFPAEYYGPGQQEALAKVASISDKLDPTGHLQISREAVLEKNPDLVIGMSDTVNRETMKQAGVPLLEEEAFCGDVPDADFQDAFAEVRMYGEVFGKQERAEEYIRELQQRLPRQAPAPTGAKVAFLYPEVGGAVTYAYGSSSMSDRLITGVGGTNVYADTPDRVFEISAESLVDRNPDYIVALYSAGDPDVVAQAVRDIPGASAITAVREGRIMPMLMGFSEPPTPLSVQGLEKLQGFVP
ncbi:ABC transporter substrate-binding protein [Corynebacterium epidermidicanis]|uniref:ABC-type Fe3+-hydroxamate transport system, periplasmic component n=1 Tax=Corynebacterium epidermidicanis TaxID=1050174 RepID=A0A0G3GT14_9CORY|nr:ABC transporter substrate-binding protein [Corynebacterium epidermidicanis]AKK04321.1 ABC-type Fe3+-hydroxamate transport system, periplasmic component [Corynebacterium epidermidicanis]